jgi:hypothetical protein
VNERQQTAVGPPAAPYSLGKCVKQWWPLVIPPAVMVAVYLARAAGRGAVIAKGPHEIIALYLLSAAAAVAGVRFILGRQRVHLVLTVLCLVFLLREVHFTGAKEVFYVSVAGIAAWCAFWRKSLLPALVGKARGRWLIVTVWAYLLALLIQRRALRFLPDEEHIHTQLEEVCENLGHLFLLLLGVF